MSLANLAVSISDSAGDCDSLPSALALSRPVADVRRSPVHWCRRLGAAGTDQTRPDAGKGMRAQRSVSVGVVRCGSRGQRLGCVPCAPGAQHACPDAIGARRQGGDGRRAGVEHRARSADALRGLVPVVAFVAGLAVDIEVEQWCSTAAGSAGQSVSRCKRGQESQCGGVHRTPARTRAVAWSSSRTSQTVLPGTASSSGSEQTAHSGCGVVAVVADPWAATPTAQVVEPSSSSPSFQRASASSAT